MPKSDMQESIICTSEYRISHGFIRNLSNTTQMRRCRKVPEIDVFGHSKSGPSAPIAYEFMGNRPSVTCQTMVLRGISGGVCVGIHGETTQIHAKCPLFCGHFHRVSFSCHFRYFSALK